MRFFKFSKNTCSTHYLIICHSFFFCFICFFLLPSLVLAQSNISGLSIDAKKMSRDSVKKNIRLTGDVQVIFKGQHLACDQATIDLQSEKIEAEGKVILQNTNVYAEAEKLTLYYRRNTGTFFNGFIKSGPVIFEGDIIQKTGENEYVAEHAYFSACDTCPPAWSFTGRKITAELGGYASIDYPVLRFGHFPVLLLPWLKVPLKTDRQSGFLVPKFLFNNTNKLGLSIPYFWAISRSQDMTVNFTVFSEQRFKPDIEYRYVLSENSKGSLRGSFLNDRFFERKIPSSTAPGTTDLIHLERERWFLNYNHHYEMPEQIIHRANLNLVSDLKYARDFPRDLDTDGEPALENQISVTKNLPHSHLSAEISYYNNQLVEDSLQDNTSSVHRFPDVKYSLMDQPIGDSPLYFGFDSNYVHFARRSFSYDDVVEPGESIGDGLTCPLDSVKCISRENDGAFEPSKGDLLRTGHRFEFIPHLSLPFRIGHILEVSPSAIYRETQYRFTSHTQEKDSNYTPTAARRYLQTDLTTKTQLSRVFGNQEDKTKQSYKHIVEPEVRYSSIPWIRRPNHYFFGQFQGQPYSRTYEPLRDEDFFGTNRVQFDYNDRIFDRQIIDFSLSNRMIRKYWKGSDPEYSTIGIFKISQSYDLNEAKLKVSYPWYPIQTLIDIRLDQLELHSIASYYPYARVTNSSSRLKLKNQKGDFIQFGLTRSTLVNRDNEVDPSNQTNNFNFEVGWMNTYVHLLSGLDFSNITHHINAWKFEAQILPPGNCWNITYSQFQLPEGKPDWDVGIHFQFGGK